MIQIGREKTTEDVDKKIPNTTGLAKMTDYNTKITEIENTSTKATNIKSKITGVTDLATKATLNTKAVKV